MIHGARVNRDQCIGCGGCEQTCPAIFKLTYTVRAEAVGKEVEKHRKKALAAYYGCPVQAIELTGDDPALQAVWHPVRVVEKRMLSDSVLEVQLATDDFKFKPGQYVTVRLSDALGFFNRAYSIVEIRNGILTLCMALLKNGRASSFWTMCNEGCELEITEPKGDFCLCDTDRPKLFVGTGTGLAPLIAMMEACPEVPKTLFFGQRTESEVFYLDRLRAIPNLDLKISLSREGQNWNGLHGRVTDQVVQQPLTKKTEIYTCGNDSMMKDLQEILKRKRHPMALFFKESFTPDQGADSTLPAAGLKGRIWVRHIHVYASLLMSVLFLFFGLSGFLASRPSLFNSETRLEVPANIEWESPELSGYFKAKLPGQVVMKNFSRQDQAAVIRFEDETGGRFDVDVNLADRSYTVTESHGLPADSGSKTSLQLAQELAKKYPGKLDANSVEEDSKQLQFTIESVWADTTVVVDKAQKRYEVRQSENRWAAALVQLHRGKKSSPVQRVLIDLTGLFMALATLTGILMSIQSRNPAMRNTALILVGISIGLAILMIINR